MVYQTVSNYIKIWQTKVPSIFESPDWKVLDGKNWHSLNQLYDV